MNKKFRGLRSSRKKCTLVMFIFFFIEVINFFINMFAWKCVHLKVCLHINVCAWEFFESVFGLKCVFFDFFCSYMILNVFVFWVFFSPRWPWSFYCLRFLTFQWSWKFSRKLIIKFPSWNVVDNFHCELFFIECRLVGILSCSNSTF
jgi:hypothetical protein